MLSFLEERAEMLREEAYTYFDGIAKEPLDRSGGKGSGEERVREALAGCIDTMLIASLRAMN